MTLSFLSLSPIPELKLTDQGPDRCRKTLSKTTLLCLKMPESTRRIHQDLDFIQRAIQLAAGTQCAPRTAAHSAPSWCGKIKSFAGRLEQSHLEQSTRRPMTEIDGHPRGGGHASARCAGRLRSLHQLRAVSDVPGRGLLGAGGTHCLCRHAHRRRRGGIRRRGNSTGTGHCPRPSASFPCNKFFVTKPSRSLRGMEADAGEKIIVLEDRSCRPG